jgi:hypothetical protein
MWTLPSYRIPLQYFSIFDVKIAIHGNERIMLQPALSHGPNDTVRLYFTPETTSIFFVLVSSLHGFY